MARRSGRNGIIKADLTTSNDGTLSTLNFVGKWTINMSRDKLDMTALGDSTKVKVAGLPDQTLSLDGHVDVGTATLSLLFDGNARKVNILPDNTNNTTTFLTGGTYVCDGSISGGVGEGVDFTCTADAFTSGTVSGM